MTYNVESFYKIVISISYKFGVYEMIIDLIIQTYETHIILVSAEQQ